MLEQHTTNELNLQFKSTLLDSIEAVCEEQRMTLSQLIKASIAHAQNKVRSVGVSIDDDTKAEIVSLSRQQGMDVNSALLKSVEQYIRKVKYDKAILDMQDKEGESEDVLMSFKVPRKLKDAFTEQCASKDLSAAREIRRLMRHSVVEDTV